MINILNNTRCGECLKYTRPLNLIINHLKKQTLFSFFLFVIITLSSCSEKNSRDEKEILSLIYNTQIGNHEHFGSPPPVPPLPPDFDKLNEFGSKAEAKQALLSEDWTAYFAEDSLYESRVEAWKMKMRAVQRKILFNTATQISEYYKEMIKESLGPRYDLRFLEVSKHWKVSDIDNQGNYEILGLHDFDEIKIDTIHVGIIQFSEIGFNQNRDSAILYIDWNCGSLCGGGHVFILQKERGNWKIVGSMNLWVN